MTTASERRVVLPVHGMHCATCVAKIEKAVLALTGVNAVAVDLPSRTVAVTYLPSATLDTRALRRAIEKAGYDVLGATETRAAAESLSLMSEQQEQGRLLARLQVAVVFSVPLLLAGWLDLSPYTALLLAIPVQVYGGWHFHQGLLRSFHRRAADSNTLVSLSTWAAFLFSVYVVAFPETLPAAARQPQWDAVVGLILLVSFGRWLEAMTRGKTNEAVARLLRIAPKTARVERGGRQTTVPLAEVEVGELIGVRPGEQIALDGVVVSGSSTVDESLLTGQSLPIEKSKDSRVWGGTINKTSALDVRVERPGSESALARIVEAIRQSQATKPRVEKCVDRLASVFVPLVLFVASLSAVVWAVYGPEPKILFALTAFVSVLSISCPSALGLSTPLAIIAGLGHAAEVGVFIRNVDVLEEVGKLDLLIFDKTGTLTEGRPRVVETLLFKGTEKQLLAYAAAAEQRSEHPFAAAILAAAKEAGVEQAPVEAFEALAGRGVAIRSGEVLVRAGNIPWLKGQGCRIPAEALKAIHGHASMLGVAAGKELLGIFVLADVLRPTAREAVRQLKALGLEVVLASGDRNEVAYHVAEQAGISRVFAEVLPEEKAAIVARLQSEGKKVAMVGESFNDAPALSRADIGIALASGTDIAIEAADVTVMGHDLTTIASAITLSQRIRKAVRENLFWAFAYNVALIPVAAGLFFPVLGVLLRPQYAGVAMALSSISVALNSLRLRRAAREVS